MKKQIVGEGQHRCRGGRWWRLCVDTAKATAYYANGTCGDRPHRRGHRRTFLTRSQRYPADDGSFGKLPLLSPTPILIAVDSQVIANAPVRFLVAGMGDIRAPASRGRASIPAPGLPTSGARYHACRHGARQTLLPDAAHSAPGRFTACEKLTW